MLTDILTAHFAAYPAMKPADAVKLIYQNEFGPGHMIPDPGKSLARLQKEMAGLAPRPGEALYEVIGNGLCRLNLRPCMARGIPAEVINQLFCDTAAGIQGDMRRFQKKLRELSALADGDEAPFSAPELDYFLILYQEKGCPAVHHSEAYARAYAPAYRVVLQKKVKDYLASTRK